MIFSFVRMNRELMSLKSNTSHCKNLKAGAIIHFLQLVGVLTMNVGKSQVFTQELPAIWIGLR